MALGGRLKAVRVTAGLTQDQLANYANLDKRQLRRFEDGAASIPAELVSTLADGCGVTVLHLLGLQADLVAAA